MIGVAIITCDRPEFFEKCIRSIPLDKISALVIVDDGNEKVELPADLDMPDPFDLQIAKTTGREGVGKAKSHAIDLLTKVYNCDHVFLIEDDIVVKDPNVFDHYIHASQVTGIQHFMFGYHGPANKGGVSKGEPQPKFSIIHKDGVVIDINQHCVGAFCYYSRKCLEKVGNFDLDYNNAFEHIDHSFRIALAGMTTPYWNWADVHESQEMLGELACSEENSSIRGRSEWRENIARGFEHFGSKFGHHPYGRFGVPDMARDKILEIVKNIYEQHGRANVESPAEVGGDSVSS